MRPKAIRLYIKKPHDLEFDEPEKIAATQIIELNRRIGTLKVRQM
jgi:hypothetical protein